MVKYLLDPPRGESMRLHAIGDYEFSYARVKHSSYNELKEGVLRCCPSAYRCIIPIVLHHELVWEMRKEEVDRLTQPIFQVDSSLPSPNQILIVWGRRSTLTLTGRRRRAYVWRSCLQPSEREDRVQYHYLAEPAEQEEEDPH